VSPPLRVTRRRFLADSVGVAVSYGTIRDYGGDYGLGITIRREVLWNGRDGGSIWFHPRPCTMPGPGKPSVLMTLQSISGSDYFGPVHWTRSDDRGRTWRDPVPVAALGRRAVEGGKQEGVCDVVPQYHEPTGTVLAIGHNVYYRAGKLTQKSHNRFPVYVVGDGAGKWSERRKLEWDHDGIDGIYTCGCSERLVCDDGDVLMAVSYGPASRRDRAVSSLRCRFDGERLSVAKTGSELRLAKGRGLLEPSLVHHEGRFWMTIRAEDGHGYTSVSDDGLSWAKITPWAWDDGEPLTMSTTQQHWLRLGEELWLVYTRRTATNAKVMRYRAPLLMARVDVAKRRLVRASERVVIPLAGDPKGAPQHVARLGNFHTLRIDTSESWVTVGESRPTRKWKGDTLLARIRT